MEVDLALVHAAHCCGVHGCKYGNEDCGVAAGTLEQKHPCEYCDVEDRVAAPLVNKIVSWLEGRIAELESLDSRTAGYIRAAAQDRAENYKDVVRGLREGAWKA